MALYSLLKLLELLSPHLYRIKIQVGGGDSTLVALLLCTQPTQYRWWLDSQHPT